MVSNIAVYSIDIYLYALFSAAQVRRERTGKENLVGVNVLFVFGISVE
jgi:hypothetical protein